ncbi:Ni/Fe hydrogenase subunit alpha [Archaeoglobus neptunius]|uniref:Ni/Fe hydrogenase subunit alpha n=1 Tax=Archaeoglobus neptunius TaxID=2798580 RepID=UPI0019265DCE|nr:Ni/Fe hydrogenase subunit alpha [Archaeoglobus neptunius]
MRIEINPVSRIEGHGKVTIFFDHNGKVERVFFQATELRGYEKILTGMPMEEVPRVVSTVCGICRAVHFIAAAKAGDQIFGVEATDTARTIREMMLCAHFIEDHTVSLLALALPDFLSPEERSIFGVVKKLGDLGRELLRKRGYAVKILQILGGRNIHPVAYVPGGWTKGVSGDEIAQIEKYSYELVDLGLKVADVVEGALSFDEGCRLGLKLMGTVDRSGALNLYDGFQVVKDQEGNEIERFSGKDYIGVIAERVVPWSYSKIPYLRKFGWREFEDGDDSPFYIVGPQSRVRLGKLTPKAREVLERISDHPTDSIMFNHLARAVEIIHAAERLTELIQGYVSGDLQNDPEKISGEGVGIVEAPRGTLIHHYTTDDRGAVRDANLVVATTQNVGAISMAVKKIAEKYGDSENLAEKIEVAIRAFDPCMACATHAINGILPLEIEIYRDGELVKVLRNYEEDSGWNRQSVSR